MHTHTHIYITYNTYILYITHTTYITFITHTHIYTYITYMYIVYILYMYIYSKGDCGIRMRGSEKNGDCIETWKDLQGKKKEI